MADYCTTEDVGELAYQSRDEDLPLLGRIITRMSRLFDAVAGVPDSYFGEVSSDVATSSRDFWGNGTDYLKIDPYLQATDPTVTMPTGWTVPGYIASNPLVSSPRGGQTAGEFFLVRTYGDDGSRLDLYTQTSDYFPAEFLNQLGTYPGWPAGIKVSIVAQWGWLETPAEVRQAVAEMTVAAWRGRDTAFARATGLDGQTLFGDALTQRAKAIAQNYYQGKAMFA